MRALGNQVSRAGSMCACACMVHDARFLDFGRSAVSDPRLHNSKPSLISFACHMIKRIEQALPCILPDKVISHLR